MRSGTCHSTIRSRLVQCQVDELTLPVASRCRRASSTPNAPKMPVVASPGSSRCTGGAAGSPVRWVALLIASAIFPNRAVAVRAAATVAGDAQHDQREETVHAARPSWPRAVENARSEVLDDDLSACRISPLTMCRPSAFFKSTH